MKIVKAILLALLAFNLLIFLIAGLEYVVGANKSHWPKNITSPNNQKSDKPTVILFHGFGGSPYDFRSLARAISVEGYPVMTPVTPHQNSDYFAHNRGAYTHREYVKWATDIISDQHRKSGKKPIVIGFSMGGALSVLSAQHVPVKKLILLAPYLDLSTLPALARPMASIFRWITPVVPKVARGQINSDAGYSAYHPGSYLVSLSAYYRLEQLKVRAQSAFLGLKIPVMVITSTNDRVSNYTTSYNYCSQVKSCTFVRLNLSNHIILFDNDAEYVTQRVLSFLPSAPDQQDE